MANGSSMKSLCVFCGSSPGRGKLFVQAAQLVGRRLAEENIQLVYGGGSVGLMGAVADACLDAGGEVIGVITEKLQDLEVGHTGCTELLVVDTMLERKTVMAERSDGFLSLPGGIGTLDEMFEMLTWSQLDIHNKPSALLNVDGYYDGLLEFLDRVVADRFVLGEHLGMLLTGNDFEDVLHRLQTYEPVILEKWVEKHTSGETLGD